MIRASFAALAVSVLAETAGAQVELIVDPEPAEAGWSVDWARRGIEGADANSQALSMLGREDLIDTSAYEPPACAALEGSADPIAEIAAQARGRRIVIVNEAHDRSRDRAFILKLADALADDGFTVYAAETILPPSDEPMAFMKDEYGHYSVEATFGRLVSRVLERGYRIVGYEYVETPEVAEANQARSTSELIALRDEAQARNLIERVLDRDPEAKLLVHVGYSHASEEPMVVQGQEVLWMAARLKAKTGLDPLTIDQTYCWSGSDVPRLATPPGPVAAGVFDLHVQHPAPVFERGRPTWRRELGDAPIDIPSELIAEEGWTVVEARPLDAPTGSTPTDRVAVRAGENVALMLPPGVYRVQAVRAPTTE